MRVTKPAMHLLLPFYKQDKKDNEKDDSREQPDKFFIEKLIPQILYHFSRVKPKCVPVNAKTTPIVDFLHTSFEESLFF